jgi:hypothetical protein
MKSGKQRRVQIKDKRRARALEVEAGGRRSRQATSRTAPCNAQLLTLKPGWSDPLFVICGYYRDLPFKCRDCGKSEVWTATQQKWWYEVAKADVWTTATRCRSCRRRERERKIEARRVHLEGVARKKATLTAEQVDRGRPDPS